MSHYYILTLRKTNYAVNTAINHRIIAVISQSFHRRKRRFDIPVLCSHNLPVIDDIAYPLAIQMKPVIHLHHRNQIYQHNLVVYAN